MGRNSSQRIRGGFISVGAVGQRSLQVIHCLIVRAWSSLRVLGVVALNGLGRISSSVLRRGSVATRRLNSSLRSHRTWRSNCRPVSSGLKKTLFAPIGPNSRGRGHQGASPAEPRASLEEKRSRLGRINAARGHRCGGTYSPERNVTQIPPHVNHSTLSPEFFSLGSSDLLFSSEACPVGRRG